jgi:soluble lytic murein transglycosylase-like protein
MKYCLHVAAVVFGCLSAFAAQPASRTVYDVTLKNGFSIHHFRHEALGETTRLYTDDANYIDVPTAEIAEMTSFEEPLPAAPAPELQDKKSKLSLIEVVAAASDKHRIDPDLISSIIHAESGFNPKAVSRKGAQGLMQLMPNTASQLGIKDAFDPFSNVDAGTHYLRDLLVRYNGDIAKALAAYNAGPARVEQYHGVPPFHETRAYVTQIIKEFNRKKLAERAQQKSAKATPAGASGNVKSR